MKKLLTLFAAILLSSSTVFAQNGGDKATPPGGLSEVEAYYLFYSDFRNDNYESALRNGRWILVGLPKTIENYPKFDLATNLERFYTIYDEMAKKASDPSLKSAYVDSADMVFDKVFETFSEDEIDYYQWHLYRGRLYQEHADFVDSADAKATAEYEKAYKLNPQAMMETGEGYYIKVLLQNLASRGTEESKQKALAIIEEVEGDANEDLSEYFDKIRTKLFDSPEERMAFLEEKVEENPEDIESLRALGDLYEEQEMVAKAKEINEKLYELDPSYQNSVALANNAMQNAEYDTAIKYLQEAQTKTEDKEKLKTIYQNLAQAYLNKENLRQARNNARKAIDMDPNWGRPYITIANVYARAVNQCSGGELTRQDRAVYWLVMDYLQKAKSVDSSVSATADSQLRSYRQATPSKEDVFFEDGWEQGGSIRIDSSLGSCYSWINESTTVR